MGRESTNDYVALTPADMVRFHRNAPAAIARRGGGYILESLANSLELIVMGATPIIGMTWYGWSAVQLLVFLVASLWVGILCDWGRLALAGQGVKKFAESHYDDWHVWVVTTALRSGKNEAPRSHVRAKHAPGAGVFVDIVCGVLSTALIAAAIGFPRRSSTSAGIFDRGFAFSLAFMTFYQVVAAAWEIIRHRRAGPDAGPVQAAPGVRGVGLFILMFVTMTVGDPDAAEGLAAQRVMLWVNWAIVVIGVLNSASMLWLQGETRWLRNYMRDLSPEAKAAALAAATPARAVKEKKRKRRSRK